MPETIEQVKLYVKGEVNNLPLNKINKIIDELEHRLS